MGKRGPKPVLPGELYAFAQLFYWEFRRIDEGSYRWKLDETLYNRLKKNAALQSEYIRITDEDRTHHEQYVDEEIRTGRFLEWIKSQRPDLLEGDKETQKEARLHDIEDGLLLAKRHGFEMWAAEKARRQLKIPGEPEVVNALLSAESPEQIREICKDAFVRRTIQVGAEQKEVKMPNWPISAGSTLPSYLSQYAAEFIEARKDGRFPRSGRPSNRRKQLWFLCRALSGAIHGVKTRTAINLVGSQRPEETFEQSRAARSVRKRRRKR